MKEIDDLEHYCAYNGIVGENKEELKSIVLNLIKSSNEVQAVFENSIDSTEKEG